MSTSFEVVSEKASGVGRVATASVAMRHHPRVAFASWRAKRVCRYVEANLEQRLDIGLLASVAYVSPAHFCRSFKQTFGITVHRYVVQRRLERARHLMLTTSATLTEIAAICGMSDHSHLTRLFRRAVNESPAAWRKRNLG